MNFNRQELLNLQNKIFNRPKRLNSLYVAPTIEDIGMLAEIPKNKLPQQSNQGMKQQSVLRTQLKKYRNLYLYDKKLFQNRRESKDTRDNIENKGSFHHVDSSKRSSQPQWEDEMKITKLSIMKSDFIRAKIPDIPKQVSTHCPRKLSNINPEPIQFKNLIVLPSIRGWDNNNQNSQRSN